MEHRSSINESMKISKTNLNESMKGSSRANKISCGKVADVDKMADDLVRIFDAPLSRLFFCKVAWHLPEWFIRGAVEDSQINLPPGVSRKIRHPVKFFVKVCKNEMQKTNTEQIRGGRGFLRYN